jgi:hypothetical protein
MYEDPVVDLVSPSPSLTADDVNFMTERGERGCDRCRIRTNAVPNDRRVLLGEEDDLHVMGTDPRRRFARYPSL